MSDNKTISGIVKIEQEGRHATALRLMDKIGSQEYAEKKSEQNSRDYWLKLFVQCENATHGTLPK